MNVDAAELLDPELLKDAESTAQHPAIVTPPDEAQTMTRLPASAPPPLPAAGALATQPLLPLAFPPPPRVAQVAHPGVAPALPVSRPSWLRSLLSTTQAPPVEGPEAPPLTRERVAVACVVAALAFALVAMITGLRGAPDGSVAPLVAAATILGRSMLALGAGAFSFGLLRMAERLTSKG